MEVRLVVMRDSFYFGRFIEMVGSFLICGMWFFLVLVDFIGGLVWKKIIGYDG